MAARTRYKTNLAVKFKYEAFYTNGKVEHYTDGSHLACRCANQIMIVDAEAGTVVRSLGDAESEDELNAFALSHDEKLLAGSYRSGLLRQWDKDTGECIRTWKSIHRGPISCMTFDSTSSLLATGGSDSTIKVWDVVGQYCTHNLKGAQGVFSVVYFHPDPELLTLFGSANDCHIRVWDLKTSKCVAVMEGHFSTVTSLSFTEDGNTLFSSGRDSVVIMWDLKKYCSVKTIPVFEVVETMFIMPESRSYPALNVNGSDLHIMTAGSKGVLRIWKAATASVVYAQPQPIVELPSKEDKATVVITQIHYLPTKDAVSVVTYEQNILLFSLQDLSLQKQLVGYSDEVLDVQFLGPNDSHIAVATNSLYIKVFELSSFACELLKGHTDIVLALKTFPSDPSVLVSCSKDCSIRMWIMDPETKTITCVAVAKGHSEPVGCLGVSKLSVDFIASGGKDTILKVWDVPRNIRQSGSVETPYTLKARFTEIAHEKNINALTVSPNDQLVASASQDKLAKLWHSQKGQFLGSFRGHKKSIWCVEFSPADQVLATSSADGTVKIWNLVDYSCLKSFEGHDTSVLKVAFLSKGMQLLSSASDGLIKLWTIKTNECDKTFDQHSDKIWGLAVSKDESLIVSGGADSTIILWKDVTEEETQDENKKQETVVLQEQKLQNLLKAKNYTKALIIALTLEQPYRALTILKEIGTREDGKEKLAEIITNLREDQIHSLLKFVCIWNTNSKHSYEAQHVLNNVLKRFTPDELLKFPEIRKTIESLIPYTERHVARLDTYIQQAKFLDYTWNCMKLGENSS